MELSQDDICHTIISGQFKTTILAELSARPSQALADPKNAIEALKQKLTDYLLTLERNK